MRKLLLLLMIVPMIGFGQETGCLSGDCENGYGTYTWASGSKYVGEWKDNKHHGQGTYIFDNGDKYIGGWNNHKSQGLAISISQDTTRTNFFNLGKPVGECLSGDCFNSFSTILFSLGNYSSIKHINNSSFQLNLRMGDSQQMYIGELKDGKPHGKGKMINTRDKGKSEIGDSKEGIWEEGVFVED